MIDPKRPSVGVPALTRQGLEDNFKAAVTRLDLMRDTMQAYGDRLDAIEGTGIDHHLNIFERLSALEEFRATAEARLERHRRRIRWLERLVFFLHGWRDNPNL